MNCQPPHWLPERIIKKRQRREASLLHVLVYQVSPNTLMRELEEYVTPRPVGIWWWRTSSFHNAAGNGHPSPFAPSYINFGDFDIRNDWQIAFGVIKYLLRPLSKLDQVADICLNLIQSYKFFMKDTRFPDNYFIATNMLYNIFSSYSLLKASTLQVLFMGQSYRHTMPDGGRPIWIFWR